MADRILDSFRSKKQLTVGSKKYTVYSIREAEKNGLSNTQRLPKSLKILLENLLRHEDGTVVTKNDVAALQTWVQQKTSEQEIAFHPARVLMQDFTGVPAVVDLAAMRDAMVALGGDPKKINPLAPVDLVIDHSVSVDYFGAADSYAKNMQLEFDRNGERYQFLRWAQTAFDGFRAVPPGTGICHQVNLEYLARVVWSREVNGETFAYPDTVVGTDSHTTMINGLSVLGWGVGGIEAEAAMLNQPVSMVIPEVIGVKLTGSMPEGATATDLVLVVTQMLRKRGVVGKFVEFFGPGLKKLALSDRATIANMAPEYGATCGFFPIDEETINFLKFTGRSPELAALVETYAKEQGLWLDETEPVFTDVLTLDLGTVEPSLAGPKRPQDRVTLRETAAAFAKELVDGFKVKAEEREKRTPVEGTNYTLGHGDVTIAAITSCTNTSNPNVLIAAGLLARKARARGLQVKPWVKTSLAPGSQVVTEYLNASGLQADLDALGFQTVGYGCTTCIGNSGPLPEKISKAVQTGNLVAAAVLSGNRNFEGRVNPDVKANYLASPPLVVAYALAGSMTIDLTKEPLGKDSKGQAVYLRDIWPSNDEIAKTLKILTSEMFTKRYSEVFKGPKEWQSIPTVAGFTFKWDDKSTYVKNPPYFVGMGKQPKARESIKGARVLALFGDSITTDHISPAGSIKEDSPAGKYLKAHGVTKADFNSYGARRGNHEVMVRGTFANIRIKNEMLGGVEGGLTKHQPSGEQMTIYDAAMRYEEGKTPTVVVAGKEYGTGSSRDWAAKGPYLLGVKAVIVESFERIHRSNLVGMGILPLQFLDGQTRKTLNLDGTEIFDIEGVETVKPRSHLNCKITRANGKTETVKLLCRIDTVDELAYFNNGGILHYVLRKLV